MPLPSSRVAAFRLNGSRLNYLVSPRAATGIFLFVPGTGWVDCSQKARVEGAAITQALNEVADTATVTFDGSVGQPLTGQQIQFTQTSPYADPVLFSGHILSVRTIFQGRARNVAYQCDCIDHTWMLTFKKVTKRYTGQTATAIVTDLVSVFGPPFFSVVAAPAVPATVLDEITFTNEDLAQAISRVCERLGLYWLVDYARVVRLFTSAALASAGTVTQTACHTIQTIAKAQDLSPIANHVYARGGGSTATVDCAVGQTTLPIDDPLWYGLGGGYVECGPQIVLYSGVSNPGTGALVGTGNAPSGVPVVGAAVGSNLSQGAHYGYAVSFVTSAGETLPGPTAPYTPAGGTIAPPPAPAVEIDYYSGSKLVIGGTYRWALEWKVSGGGRVGGAASASLTIPAGSDGRPKWVRVSWSSAIFNGVDPSVIGLYVHRTTNNGSTFYYDLHEFGRNQGYVSSSDLVDSDLVQMGQMSGSGPTMLAASLSQIPIYPKAGVATARKVYRTAANGSQLKLLTTIADNTTITFLDTVTDAALGVNAPTTDTSGIQGGGQINAGAASILVSNINPFSPSGGWVTVGNMVLRFTGRSGSSLVLAVPLPSTLSYGSEILNAPHLFGIPPSGGSSILYPIKSGDAVYVALSVVDQPSIDQLAAWVGYGDGRRMEFFTDGRLSLAELEDRASALLAYRKDPLVTITFTTRDPAVSIGKTITFNLTSPPLVGTFLIQRVQITNLPSAAHVKPIAGLRTVEASSRRFTFDDLVQQLKLVGRIN